MGRQTNLGLVEISIKAIDLKCKFSAAEIESAVLINGQYFDWYIIHLVENVYSAFPKGKKPEKTRFRRCSFPYKLGFTVLADFKHFQ